MFCPEANSYRECPNIGCPFYLKELDVCLKALEIKKNLDILSAEEKQALAQLRKKATCPGNVNVIEPFK